MRKHAIAMATLMSLCMSLPVLADSTTTTTLAVEGAARVGGTITMHVVLTGNHIVFVGQGTVSGGTVDLYVDGAVIAHVQIDGHNSNQTKRDPCVVIVQGACLADRVYGDRTEFGYPVTLSKVPGQHVFGAVFTGDDKSHGSSAPNVAIRAASVDISAVTNLLLNN
jgi:hypothetical protein